MTRRRPVPSAWREEHHQLTTSTHFLGGWGGHGRVYRTRGRCSCGARWPGPNADNMTSPDVIEAWKDHVESAYYATRDAMSDPRLTGQGGVCG